MPHPALEQQHASARPSARFPARTARSRCGSASSRLSTPRCDRSRKRIQRYTDQHHGQHPPHAGQQRQFERAAEGAAAVPAIRKSSSPGRRRSPKRRTTAAASACTRAHRASRGTIRNSVPSELWCRVESSTPRIISGTEIAVDPFQRLVPAELLEHHRQEFEEQHGGVERDAPGHFEHHRVRIPHHQRMPEAVGPAQVEQQRRPPPAHNRGTRSESPAAGRACTSRY